MKILRSIGGLLIALAGLGIVIFAGIYVNDLDQHPFHLGLDLNGGTQVTYTVDTADVPEEEISGRVSALQYVIERRVNALGVSEPNVYTVTSSALAGVPSEHRLVIELPGVTDVTEATEAIGKTPYLEFRVLDRESGEFVSSGLQGGHVASADVQFLPGLGGTLTNEPIVVVNFNGEGSRLFADLTRANVGNAIAIVLDGTIISSPIVNDVILGGSAQISGSFDLESATELAESLNLGALPVPITLSGTRTVSPTLGSEVLEKSSFAGLVALAAIILLFLVVYRFVGLVAAVALVVYCTAVLTIFKGIPVVLTAAGLAGFVMSIGFAVDANVLIFERMREELGRGASREEAVRQGCKRAWSAIRDANITSMIIALLLFWFGTSIVKGFAFAFIVGVLISMLSAYILTRLLLRSTTAVFSKRLRKLYLPPSYETR
ncbi:MAG: protein translocase subunit SecD [Candidatus Kaiserbacteria bacterium]|nr:protein translocase subunit SecD [Candidatus Kaiserbacteria bacterium]